MIPTPSLYFVTLPNLKIHGMVWYQLKILYQNYYKKTSQSADSLHYDLTKIYEGPLYFLSNFLDRAVN